jgi:hypothetical protein
MQVFSSSRLAFSAAGGEGWPVARLPLFTGACPWPKPDLKGVDHTTAPSKTAADKESQKSAGLPDERSVNGSPV